MKNLQYYLRLIRAFIITLLHYIVWIILMIGIFLSCGGRGGDT
jgi:hypothetical protein